MFVDLKGRKFSRLKVLRFWGKRPNGLSIWFCLCDCGKKTKVLGTYLLQGVTRSCGCLRVEHALSHPATKHGMTKTPEYKAFKNAQNRCKAKSGRTWRAYGKNGIKFLFKDFWQWFKELGYRPSSKYSVHRIKSDRHYEPGNVKWATIFEQNSSLKRLS